MSMCVMVRKGEYRDSVVLMRASLQLQAVPGIQDAIIVMGTDSNKAILRELGMLNSEAQLATADDLVIAVKAGMVEDAERALDKIESYFVQETETVEEASYSSLEAAMRAAVGANLAVVSVPGEYAAREARKALQAGLNVLLFSANVSLKDEIGLKRLADERNLLLMGPDCGVCNINGAALALASIVGRGAVGIVGASGSGLQEVSALLDRAHLGVSQAIGTGGRDLHDQVGAFTTLRGFQLLRDDSETAVIVLVGKVPTPGVAATLSRVIGPCPKPVIACFLGGQPDEWEEYGAYFAPTMDAAAQLAAALVRNQEPVARAFSRPQNEISSLVESARASLGPQERYVRGLFGAGTFVAQAQAIFSELGMHVRSNSPFAGGIALTDPNASLGHSLIDLGDETFTRGRAHPVIDPLPYRLRILKEVQDPETAVLLLDVILGPAAHPDPAGYLVSALHEARQASNRQLTVVASVCGTSKDPQDALQQEGKLQEAGVIVMPTSAQAARLASLIVASGTLEMNYVHRAEMIPKRKAAASHPKSAPGAGELLRDPLRVVNVGVASLADALRAQRVKVFQVVWQPPAGGDFEIIRLLERLDTASGDLQRRIDEANKRAYEVFVKGQPTWIDVRSAGDVIPGFHKRLILHTGPAIDLEGMVPQHRDGVIGGILFEGLARTREEAVELIRRGEVQIAPGLDYGSPSAGMAPTTYSMPVIVVEDAEHGTMGFCPIYEGPSYEGLRWGVYNDAVAENWKWLKEVLRPILSAALQRASGLNLRNIITRSLQMGDENHSRQLGSTLLIIAELASHISKLERPSQEIARCFEFLRSTERFAQSVYIAGATAVLRAAKNIPYCSVVTDMGGNGVQVGIKASALGDQWFTAPAPIIRGSYLNPNWTPEDTVPFAGDSCTLEVFGLGGLAAAASPNVTILAGGSVQDAVARTRDMWEITVGKHPSYTIPYLNNQGVPTAIDIIRVVETGIVPQSHAGIIHKKGGQAGAGVAYMPMECFRKAFVAFADAHGLQ